MVGNKLAIIAFLVSATVGHVACVQVQLSIKNSQEIALEQAAVGKPFVIQVRVKGAYQNTEPHVQGIEQFQIDQRFQSIHVVNGDTTITYRYVVRAAQPGTYTIGPATVHVRGTHHRSQACTVLVANTEQIRQKKSDIKKKKDKKYLFAHLSTDASTVVVGQSVSYRLRCYYHKKHVQIVQVHAPTELEHARIVGAVDTTTGIEDIEGVSYHYTQWCWQVCPQQAGQLTIPAHAIDYTVSASSKRRSPFAFFFGHDSVRKRAYTNALTITVDPLPAHDKTVHAIGTCHQATLQVEPTTLQTGKAAVVTMTVIASDPLEMQTTPTLSDIAPALKLYPSQQYCQRHQSNYHYKFEYIVHGQQAGTWEIPSQAFTYFDVQERSYHTLYTDPVMVQVLDVAAADESSKLPDNDTHSMTEQTEAASHADEVVLASLAVDVGGIPSERMMPWSWFFGFVLSMMAVACIIGVPPIRTTITARLEHYTYIRAFARAHHAVRTAEREKAGHKLYEIFVLLYKTRLRSRATHISYDALSTLTIGYEIIAHRWTPHDRQEWEQFVMRMAESVFYQQAEMRIHDTSLFEQAHYWIDRLKEIV